MCRGTGRKARHDKGGQERGREHFWRQQVNTSCQLASISNTMYTDPSFSDRTIPTAFSFSLLTIYIKSANRQQERETHNHNTYHTVDIAGGPPWHE